MADMLSSAVSGLKAFQTALDTTSHNISNSATTGYSRQVVNITSQGAQATGGGYVGNGSQVSSIQRMYSDLLADQVRTSSSSMSRSDIYSSLAEQVSNLFADSTTGLSASLQNLADAFQNVANSPTSSAERQTLLSEAQTLVDQLSTYEDKLSSLAGEVNAQLKSETSTISSLAAEIAQLNKDIQAASATGQSPNDMLDQRDSLIDELATHVSLTTAQQSDGSVNVYIGTGQALVVGATASKLTTAADPYDSSKLRVVVQSSGSTVDVTSSMTGGTIGGLLDFRSDILEPAQNTLGLISLSVADTINSQQNAGMDLNGALGADLFEVGDVSVLGNRANTGSASVSVTRSDVSAMTADNYILTSTSSGWQLKRADTGQSVAMTGTGTTSDPFVAEGLSFTVSGTASTGDSYLIKPTSTAVSQMSVAISDPDEIAAAAPIIASASSSNSGTASISQGEVVDSTNANLRDSVTIEFLSSSTYTTDGGTTVLNYTSGDPIEVNGWQVTITGTPATGDTFTVEDNAGGTGDNRNALLLANAFDQDWMSGGTGSINEAVSEWVADVGVKTDRAQTSLTTQSALYEDNLAALQSVSGVNTDEEAANLIYYQQAYEAAAQVIAVASALFDSLLNAVEG